MKHLLDVNVLLAGIWTAHPQHAAAFAWLANNQVVLCPIVEIGFLRISTNKKAFAVGMNAARRALSQFHTEMKIGWIPDDLPPLESHPATSEEVTDHYLADLAHKHGLKLATLDKDLRHPVADLIH